MSSGEGQTEVVNKTHKELRAAVAQFAAAMKAMGISKGDRVVGKSCSVGCIQERVALI